MSESVAAPEPSTFARLYRHIDWIPFWGIHLAAAVGLYMYGLRLELALVAFGLWAVRMFGITAGYHRYFSHRAFKTGRIFQFVLAFIAQASSQKGALWWASHHRVHHKLSDEPGDLHSPVQKGFWYSHVGWLFDEPSQETRFDKIRDFAKYPELVFLNTFWVLPVVIVGAIPTLVYGLEGLLVGFFLSTVVLWHTTFFINSLAHVFGKRRFATTDDSRNHWFLALLTFGEGWHNNHHHYQSSARQGFYWWEIDLSYYILVVLSKIGLVWDLREVPEHVLAEGREIDAARRQGVEPPKFVPNFEATPAE